MRHREPVPTGTTPDGRAGESHVEITPPRPLLRELMRLAASAASLDMVYQSALHCVQRGLGIERASLLLFDATGTMRFVAWSGLSDDYRRAVDGHSPWSRDESDATPILVSDVTADPALAGYAPLMQREGIGALAFIPLQFGATLLGKFMLYYRHPHVFSGSEVATAEQIANYVVFALEHHRIAVALEEQIDSERDLRQRAESEALQRRESEGWLRVALKAGQMGAWNWDLATGRIHWSEELERMHGLAPGTFGGTTESLLQFIHPLDAERFAAAHASAESSREPYEHQFEYRIVRADGGSRWLTARGRFVSDGEGRRTQMVGVTADITELKRLAETAAEADRRKDDFLATLAHELRNPLAAVRIGVAGIRKASEEPPTVVEYCTVLERQVRHLTRLVDDLLDVADITRRGLPLQKSRIELAAVVNTAVEQGRVLVEEAGHELSVTMPGTPVMLDGDQGRLVQVVANLLANAVKYTPPGGQVSLTAVRDGGEIRLSVKDSGLGIPTDKLESIFEMFGQLDRSLETGNKGLGIGLALARAIVSMHGGRIKACSDGLGAGSEFSVWLPLAPEPARPAGISAPPAGARQAVRCRVLLVDDNPDVVVATSRWLRQLGYDICVAGDGAAAIEVAREFLPRVVLLDIAMPKVNGYEVARTLRAAPWGRDMALVAVTGWGREGDQRRAVEAGFDRHMTKPVDPFLLEAVLESFASD